MGGGSGWVVEGLFLESVTINEPRGGVGVGWGVVGGWWRVCLVSTVSKEHLVSMYRNGASVSQPQGAGAAAEVCASQIQRLKENLQGDVE